MKVPDRKVSVAEFYTPVMSQRRPEVQRLVIQLLQREFNQARELEANILAVAATLRAELAADTDTSEGRIS